MLPGGLEAARQCDPTCMSRCPPCSPFPFRGICCPQNSSQGSPFHAVRWVEGGSWDWLVAKGTQFCRVLASPSAQGLAGEGTTYGRGCHVVHPSSLRGPAQTVVCSLPHLQMGSRGRPLALPCPRSSIRHISQAALPLGAVPSPGGALLAAQAPSSLQVHTVWSEVTIRHERWKNTREALKVAALDSEPRPVPCLEGTEASEQAGGQRMPVFLCGGRIGLGCPLLAVWSFG